MTEILWPWRLNPAMAMGYKKQERSFLFRVFSAISTRPSAANLFYFVIKDHPYSDGNKRIGAFLFLLFLKENNLLDQSGINDNGLVAQALLIAESDPKQKELMIRLIMNLLAGDTE